MKVRFVFLELVIYILFITVTVSCRKDSTSISLNRTSLFLEFRDTITLIATVHPNSYSNEVIWKSSDTNIVTITPDGLVTAFSNGNATITATVHGSKKTAICLVTVIDYREKWIGDWDFVKIDYDFYWGAESWDTTYYSDKISLGNAYNQIYIGSSIISVDKNGHIYYGNTYGGFTGSNRIYLKTSGGAMNGSTKWTVDVEGIKREEGKELALQ
ncbi:MAG: Ig-like domain-containing protein [Bacteroidales bacterium]